ncbi:MAG: (d)CMP kinase [Candidatus Neomarinimicrobiota bacterium]|jgi:cytidylate kinase|uniref:(d)CMP kinase n=1 Tax=marine metagenome TaxID=408172 RepID=A0A381NM51_9ZZZZ|nr:(d)CMP kinase [Candidatus Neomarinimicrobiota bacterium]|tara:strand:+ start:92 stop:751 length:660 start_codon:yes stop_codon:yes gene_type:complete
MVITIDGAAGVGKTTTAKKLARMLGFRYLDTGAMYRAITYFFIQHQVDIESKNMVISSLDTLNLDVSFPIDRPTKIVLDGEDISEDIRKKVVTNRVSQVSAIEDVRKKMVKIQKEIVSDGNFVVEGRDIGTVVFPNAEHKFFLVADYDTRAKRRLKDFHSVNEELDLSDIKNDLIRRDERDKNRKLSPLKKAEGAVVIDTSNCSIDEQVESIYKYIERV